MHAKLLQSCPTLCDPRDGSPPGSSIPGILQARTLEWIAISFSNTWKWKVKVKSLSRVQPSATPWTSAFQAPPSMGFSRQECWSGVPWPFYYLTVVMGLKFRKRLRWEVLNQSLSWDTVRLLARAAVIRTLDWGWRIQFQDSSLTGLWQETSVLCHMGLSIGLFSVVPACQLTSSVWVSERERTR